MMAKGATAPLLSKNLIQSSPWYAPLPFQVGGGGVVRSARGTYPNLSILSCFLACSCCLSSITHSTFHCHLKKRLLHQLCIHRYIALVCTFGIQQYIRYIPCRRTIPIPNPMPKYWSFLAISSYQKELARLCTTKVSLPSFSST